MTLKNKISKFLLFFYIEHVKEDWDDYNKVGKIFIYPLWIIRSIILWLISPLYIPEYLFKNSNVWKVYQNKSKIQSMEDQIKIIKKYKEQQIIQKQNFLNKKKKK